MKKVLGYVKLQRLLLKNKLLARQNLPQPNTYNQKRTTMSTAHWKLWEVFLRSKNGLSHKHVGSLHAADAEMAIKNARDVYTRRSEGISIWVVPSEEITASAPDEKEPLFAPSDDKVYRHPTFYDIPDDIEHM